MARIKILQDNELAKESKDIIDMYKDKTGVNHNIYRAIASHPALLTNFMNYTSQIRSESTIDPKLSELIMYFVSNINECEYWGMARVASGKQKGIEDSKFKFIFDYKTREDVYSECELVVLNFVEKSIKNSKSVTDKDVEELKKFFSDSQIIEILFFISYMLTTNTIINTLDIEIPEELKLYKNREVHFVLYPVFICL